jgi:hypothetical protein
MKNYENEAKQIEKLERQVATNEYPRYEMHGPVSAFSKNLDLDPAHEDVQMGRGRSQ